MMPLPCFTVTLLMQEIMSIADYTAVGSDISYTLRRCPHSQAHMRTVLPHPTL